MKTLARSNTMKHRPTNLRKAAILVASLDERSARKLLGQMTDEQNELLRQAISELGPIDPNEQDEVIEEFFRIGPLVPDKQPSGIELDSGLARRIAIGQRPAPRHYEQQRHYVEEHPSAPPFRFLHEAPVDTLAPLLSREHPQTVAVVVSHLPPNRAAELLALLPAAMQADVARRLVDLDEADPEIIREVERGLESWLSQQVRSDRRRSAGLAALHNILAAGNGRISQDIVSNLATHDRQLASKLQPQASPQPSAPRPPIVPMTFAHVTELNDAGLGAVLRTALPEVVLLALAGAPPELVDRVLRRLPLDEGRTLRYALDHLGPTRLSDVEEAQQQLADVAMHLEETGQLTRPKRRLSLAA